MAVVAAGWPTLVAAGCLIVLVAALAVRAPAAALVVALGLAGFEGTLKVLLTGEQIPGPASPAAVGAGVIDAAFALAFVGLAVRHRRHLVDLVRGLDRWERIVLGSLAAWIGLSLIQIPLSSDVSQAASGFRLTQMYVGAGLAALLAARLAAGPRVAHPGAAGAGLAGVRLRRRAGGGRALCGRAGLRDRQGHRDLLRRLVPGRRIVLRRRADGQLRHADRRVRHRPRGAAAGSAPARAGRGRPGAGGGDRQLQPVGARGVRARPGVSGSDLVRPEQAEPPPAADRRGPGGGGAGGHRRGRLRGVPGIAPAQGAPERVRGPGR